MVPLLNLVKRILFWYGQRMLGRGFNVHPVAEEVGTVWGFGDFSGEIHTH